MTNYIKSECYRIFHTKPIYLTALTLSGLTFLFNLVLWLFHRFDPEFRYATTSFSYSNLVSQPMFYCIAAFAIAAILYEGETRNGTQKNSIAYGISRTSLFLGKCLISLFASFLALIPVMAVYAGSTALLLPQQGPVTLQDLLMEIPAVSLVAVSAAVLGIFLLELFEQSIFGILVWYLILFGIPKVLFLLSIKLEFLQPAALWLPANFFEDLAHPGMQVTTTTCITVWDTGAGMAKCLTAGAIGTLLFGLWAIATLRKKDI